MSSLFANVELSNLQYTLVAVAVICISLWLLSSDILFSHFPPSPPGPRGLPFIGVPHRMPKQQEWLAYTEWAKKYGPMLSVNVLGQTIVFVSSPELSHELLEKRSAIYSDRPPFPMLELMGYGDWNVGLMPYGEKLRTARKLLLQTLNPQAILEYRVTQQREVHKLLGRLLEKPENFAESLRRAVLGTIMMILYGHTIGEDGEDEYVQLVDEAVLSSTRAGSPAAYLVNSFPVLKYIPEWMPGAGFKKEAREGLILAHRVLEEPVDTVKRKMAEGTALPSFVSKSLQESEDPQRISLVKGIAATSYGAGVDTTTSTLLTFVLAMTLFPAAQKKAQEEIDAIIGTDRLPIPEDRDKKELPYLEAVLKETCRWHPPGNIGLPHRLMQDDTINDYGLKAGTVVLSNIWAILHDEERYPRPFDFIPERYFGKQSDDVEDPRIHVFGYGRRVCPGRPLAEASLWLTMVTLLAVFDIRPAKDANGFDIPITVEYTSGVMSRPKDFKCSIVPRSSTAVELIRGALERL